MRRFRKISILLDDRTHFYSLVIDGLLCCGIVLLLFLICLKMVLQLQPLKWHKSSPENRRILLKRNLPVRSGLE